MMPESDMKVFPQEGSPITCPLCNEDISSLTTGGSEYVTCPKCNRNIHLARYFWVQKGVGIFREPQLRCPNCYRLFAMGDYSDRGQEIKCRDCGHTSTFIRIDSA